MYFALLIIWLPIPYQTNSCRTKAPTIMMIHWLLSVNLLLCGWGWWSPSFCKVPTLLKPRLHHFHIGCKSKQQDGQMSFEHRLMIQIAKYWSFEDAKQILDKLFSVLGTPVVEFVSTCWNRDDKNNHASTNKE